MTDYTEVANYFGTSAQNLAKSSEGYKAFGKSAQALLSEGVLSLKQKEMIAIALAIAARCDACISHHVKAGINTGLTREEMVEIINVAILMGGGPSSMYGASALTAYDQLKK